MAQKHGPPREGDRKAAVERKRSKQRELDERLRERGTQLDRSRPGGSRTVSKPAPARTR
jgi:hypothetical protein